jgi:hypothetical protein
MVRLLLDGRRLVFTPRPEMESVQFHGTGYFGRVFEGLIPLPVEALASPTGTDASQCLVLDGISDVAALA